ncbi:peptidoglycan-binding protein [Prauserella rugosa]|uniref:Uncharacterized protein n=1 Tax=Prauserella rugosa TaxID=43354 RepID=A0A660CH39_9PSEU|nr:peptidoglycan-binding protein [Prauserella rugosa]KMS84738.1 peptidoglycan-binding protein [Streptomyces regensis]TWH20849.1 hypothetical protein JD82_02698 [Prauserella rugosa]
MPTVENPSTLDDPSLDRPKAMDDIDRHAEQAKQLKSGAVNQQAKKIGGAGATAGNVGDDLKAFREDVLRGWDGKDAEAVAEHLSQLSKASYKVSDKAEAARKALAGVSEILADVKRKVAQLAQEAGEKDAENRKLISAARDRKNSSDDENDISSAAEEIERLRNLNERDANGKKEDIKRLLDNAESEIDELLKPLGLEIEGGFVELLPADSGAASTSASNASPAPINMAGGDAPAVSSGGGGGSAGGGGGADYAASGVAPGGGTPGKVNVTGDNPAAIAESVMGKSAAQLIASGELPMNNVPTNVCCANFVTACLEKAGWIDWHSDSVSDMAAKLKADGWQSVPVSEAPPGSVVISNDGGHTVMVGDGDPPFIGSNNINPDGSQSISAGGESGMVEVLAPPPGLVEQTMGKN